MMVRLFQVGISPFFGALRVLMHHGTRTGESGYVKAKKGPALGMGQEKLWCVMKEPSPGRFYGIPEDGFIGGENNKAMCNGLADQHTVKGVLVIIRETGQVKSSFFI